MGISPSQIIPPRSIFHVTRVLSLSVGCTGKVRTKNTCFTFFALGVQLNNIEKPVKKGRKSGRSVTSREKEREAKDITGQSQTADQTTHELFVLPPHPTRYRHQTTTPTLHGLRCRQWGGGRNSSHFFLRSHKHGFQWMKGHFPSSYCTQINY